MDDKKKIVGICGSASRNSSNLTILRFIAETLNFEYNLEIIDDLRGYPHFSTEYTDVNVPAVIVDFRNKIKDADGVIICTPEYVFSLPAGLKNILEWCVSTTVFSGKATGLITAAASGAKGHESLQLIMKTIQADFTNETTLLIHGVRSKVLNGKITDKTTRAELEQFIRAYKAHTQKESKVEE